jgi:hypothetical protein
MKLRLRPNLTRYQFEKLIKGSGLRAGKRGHLKTVSNGSKVLTARTWRKLARLLRLV